MLLCGLAAFFVLRIVNRAYFKEPGRADVAAAAISAAFVAGVLVTAFWRSALSIATTTPTTCAAAASDPVLAGGAGSLDVLENTQNGARIGQGQIIVKSGSYAAIGWLIDKSQTAPALGPCLLIDDKIDGRAESTYGTARPDVAKALRRPDLLRSGFTVTVPSAALGPGPHTIAIASLSHNGSLARLPGTWRVYVR